MTTATLVKVPVSLVDAGPNDRKEFEAAPLAELAASIKELGCMQPPTLRPVGDRYEIVAGERRFRAMVSLGWTEIPAIIRTMSDAEASAGMLAENLNRVDLDPLAEAEAYQSRISRFGYSITECAELACVPAKRVRERLSLLRLAESIAHQVSRKAFPISWAAVITTLDHNRQYIAYQAWQKGVSIDAYRALASRLQAEQDQEGFFDADSFLTVEEYVRKAEDLVAAATTIDEMEADPVGLSEIAQRLGVKPKTVSMWRYRDQLPAPRWTVGGSPIWQWSDIQRWHESRKG